MSKYYNQHHLPAPEFSPGDKVWLLRRNIKTTRPSDKLDYKKIGPYKIIEKRGKSSYLLKLPPTLKRLHPIFHVSLLKPALPSTTIPDQIQDYSTSKILPSPEILNPEIATILDSRKIGQRYEYLIHWKELPDSENSWIPFVEISTSLYPYLEQFHRRNPSHPHPPRFQIIDNLPIPPPPTIPTSAADYNSARSSTPPLKPWSQLQNYEPPTTTITHTG